MSTAPRAAFPGGNVPWTYRHYESLYAGGVVATIDFRQRDMLVPLPRENMVHVPDGAPIVPAVREAIEMSRSCRLSRKRISTTSSATQLMVLTRAIARR